MRSSSFILSEFLLTNLKALATSGTSSLVRMEHFSANLVLEFPMVDYFTVCRPPVQWVDGCCFEQFRTRHTVGWK